MTCPPSCARVRDRVLACDARGLADLVIALSDAERAEAARHLPDLRDELRGVVRDVSWHSGPDEGDGAGGYGEMLRIAGAGVLSGPAATAAWLTRREFAHPWPRLEEVARVLAARPGGWQADVAARLTRKIRTPDDRDVPLVLAVLRATGATPPEHDPLVTAWVRTGPADDDPLLGPLLPRIFEAEGVGRELREERLTPAPTPWLSLMGRLLATGRVSRAELLDGCLRRFLRGGDGVSLRFFVRVHELLDPTPQEAAARIRDYLRLLPVAPGSVAELALAQLRRVGPLEPAETAEAAGALTFRAEAKLALGGLRLIEGETGGTAGHPHAAELAAALATAFGHTSYEVQGRAARIALKRAAALAPAAQVLAEAVPLLPEALGTRVAGRFGGEVARQEPPETFTPPPLPAPAAPEPFPEPTLDVWQSVYMWVDGERWLAAFVRRAAADREGLRRTLAEQFGGVYPQVHPGEAWVDVSDWIGALAREVTDPEPAAAAGPEQTVGGPEQTIGGLEQTIGELLEAAWSGAVRLLGLQPQTGPMGGPATGRMAGSMAGRMGGPAAGPVAGARPKLPPSDEVAPPHLFLLRRLDEIHRALRAGTLPPVLLATPTLTTGHLDPAVLVERLAECAAAGAEPLPADLAQALLRLPRGRHPEAAGQAARIGSPAAATAARWLAEGGLRDPETHVRWSYLDGATDRFFDEHEPAERPYQIRLRPTLRAEPTGLEALDELLGPRARWSWFQSRGLLNWWPSLLPSHREVVAADYLPDLTHPGVAARWVRDLADADGPAGEAMALVLAFQVARADSEAAALLVRMAARGDLPAEEVGAQVALLLRRTPHYRERPIVGVLADAARQGAYEAVWRLLTRLLPALLPAPGERPRVEHTEAVTLAADVAAWTGARGPIPEVSAYATAGGRSRFARACARLHDQLSQSEQPSQGSHGDQLGHGDQHGAGGQGGQLGHDDRRGHGGPVGGGRVHEGEEESVA
ncbi:DUF6493 family protein [Nonomuraea sp. LP-02]|uniref:DUF7824 domain-containing protein n=1 Tax=Nonomuraea sp. LP-02 TaxID=3097960 RepID=UPI002E35D090|nr:DUF6493 family protein [Nonomuraea sp. LP-02]MED7924188.1 DUF6493 family protein [Nonomuraea sp. LP-02]